MNSYWFGCSYKLGESSVAYLVVRICVKSFFCLKLQLVLCDMWFFYIIFQSESVYRTILRCLFRRVLQCIFGFYDPFLWIDKGDILLHICEFIPGRFYHKLFHRKDQILLFWVVPINSLLSSRRNSVWLSLIFDTCPSRCAHLMFILVFVQLQILGVFSFSLSEVFVGPKLYIFRRCCAILKGSRGSSDYTSI